MFPRSTRLLHSMRWCSPMPISITGARPPALKYGYEGPVYPTPPTRDLSAMLQLDYLDVIHKEDRKVPYSSNEVKTYIRHSITLNYGSVTDIAPDIKLTFHNAGHILGSAIAISISATGCTTSRLPAISITARAGSSNRQSPVPPARSPLYGKHVRGIE